MIQVDVCKGASAQVGVSLDDVETERKPQNAGNAPSGDFPANAGSFYATSVETPAPFVEAPAKGGDTPATSVSVPASGGEFPGQNGERHGSSIPFTASPVSAPLPPVAWVDLVDPTDEDWATLQQKFAFHPLAIEDAKGQNERAKLDEYDGYLFLSLRAWAALPEPAHKNEAVHDDLQDVTAEVDVFLGPNYIVTIHNAGLPVVEQTRKRWTRHYHPEGSNGNRHRPAYLLYLLLDAMVDGFFPVMDKMDEEIDHLETAIYDDDQINDTDTLKSAIRLRKRLLLLRQTVTPIREVVNDILRTEDERLLPGGLRPYWQDVYDHALRLVEQIDLHREIFGWGGQSRQGLRFWR